MGRWKVGARGAGATAEKQTSEGRGMAHGGGGARNVQRAGAGGGPDLLAVSLIRLRAVRAVT